MSKKSKQGLTPAQHEALSSYGVKRTVGVGPGTPRKKRPPVVRWLALVAVVSLLGFGIFSYLRVSSFLDSSFSGRNEGSLLTPVATGPARTGTPSVTKGVPKGPEVSGVATPLATVTPAKPGLTAVAVPVTVPTATATPDYAGLPAIIQKIKLGLPMRALLLGYGGRGHDGAFLTDTILEVSYDPSRNAVTMVNIPRDLYVFVPYGGPKVGYWGKINSAFSYVMETGSSASLSSRYRFNASDQNSRLDAAAILTKDVVEQVTGIPVDYWATLSFEGFRKFIDAIGGVDVNVETTFDDYEYPANDDPEIDASVMHIHFEAGLQHMYGERAIEYSRSRKSVQDGNDFGRSKRQMRMITAVKDQAAQPGVLLKAFGVMDALQGNIRTSLTLGETRALFDYFRGDGASSLKNVLFVPQILSTNNFLAEGTSPEGGYILFPNTGQSNYSAIQRWLELGQEFPEVRAENLKVSVQNGTGMTGLSRQVSGDLEQNGLNTLDAGWVSAVSYSMIYDYSGGKSSSTLKTISNSLPEVPVRVLKKPDSQTADVVVVLGRDYMQVSGNAGSNSSGSKTGGLGGPTPQAVNIPVRDSTPTP